jgi:hypothetical protein
MPRQIFCGLGLRRPVDLGVVVAGFVTIRLLAVKSEFLRIQLR